MKKIFFNFCIFVIILIFAAISLMFVPFFNIQNIIIEGNSSVSEEEILSVLNVGTDTNLLAFNSFSAKRELLQNSYIKDVEIIKAFPQVLKVNITEHKVRAYVPYTGNYLYIGDDGLILDIQPTFTEQLPVVIGLNFTDFTLGQPLHVEDTRAFEDVVELSKLFTKYELLGDIIKVDVAQSDSIHLYVNKVDVNFGSLDDGNQKILTLIEILPNLDTQAPGILDISDVNVDPTFKFLT